MLYSLALLALVHLPTALALRPTAARRAVLPAIVCLPHQAASAASATFDFGYRFERALDPEKRGPATDEGLPMEEEREDGISLLDAMCNPAPPGQESAEPQAAAPSPPQQAAAAAGGSSRAGSVRMAAVAVLPDLCVFDLDACLWDKEMFEMAQVPEPGRDEVRGDLNGRGEGVVGVLSGGDRISLHRGALIALQEHADGNFPGMRVALASSANTRFAERVGRAALGMLEVLPGVSVWSLLMRDWDGRDVNMIGRQAPLSPQKWATHFPLLREATGVRFDRMLFFDDCNWGDHVGQVTGRCKEADTQQGVIGVRTPQGLGESEFREGLRLFAARRAPQPDGGAATADRHGVGEAGD
mmetsp:Transcript_51523/g.170727  ORF Transcript_51523/g.170727 Transcript_51523/m.170727 type:complete len:356 (+) Transcript_51523:24-1091(+)